MSSLELAKLTSRKSSLSSTQPSSLWWHFKTTLPVSISNGWPTGSAMEPSVSLISLPVASYNSYLFITSLRLLSWFGWCTQAPKEQPWSMICLFYQHIKNTKDRLKIWRVKRFPSWSRRKILWFTFKEKKMPASQVAQWHREHLLAEAKMKICEQTNIKISDLDALYRDVKNN